MSFPLSNAFERWVTSLRLSWMGTKSRAIMGGFAAVLGDKAVDWAKQSLFEHLPLYASAPSVALIAADRLIDAGPSESTASLAQRLAFAMTLWRYAGSQFGMLLALHYAGFDNAIIVQQNGAAWQLTLPLPTIVIGQAWDPTPNIVQSNLGLTIAPFQSWITTSRRIPTGTPWWVFDGNSDFCSRFAVLFPVGTALPTASQLTTLKAVIAKWGPRKATCMGITYIQTGQTWDWPVRTWDTNGVTWDGNTQTFYSYP